MNDTDDIKNMVAVYINEHGVRPTKICMTVLDYNLIRYETLSRIRTSIDIPTANEVEENNHVVRVCGMTASIGEKTYVMG